MDFRYWARAVRSLARNMRQREFAKNLLIAGLEADSRPRALRREFFTVYPEARTIAVSTKEVEYMEYRPFNMDPVERFCVGAIACLRQPIEIFEIGTYDGSTTELLARLVPRSQVFTLDLPPHMVDAAGSVVRQALAVAGGVGSRFRNTPEAARITQLFGDSSTFDFSPYFGRVGLVVVDGSHEYEVVKSDAENALRLIGPNGVIVWDDYAPQWPGVVQAVDEVVSRHDLEVFRIAQTELAVYDSSKFPGA